MRAGVTSILTSRFPKTEELSLCQGSLKPSYTQRYKTIHLSSTASRLSTGDGGWYTWKLSLQLCFLFLVAPGREKMIIQGKASLRTLQDYVLVGESKRIPSQKRRAEGTKRKAEAKEHCKYQ